VLRLQAYAITSRLLVIYFGSTGVWTPCFMLARKVIYCLSHASRPSLQYFYAEK
jgi:hypothetical protein